MVKPPGAILKAPNGDRVPYPVGIKEPIKFPIHSVGAEALKDYLPEDVRGAALINKAQELYANVFRPHLMLLTRGSWVVCSSNSDLIVTRTQQEAEEFAYRYFQPADGSVDCFVTCVGSEFAELFSLDDDVEITHKDGQKDDFKGTGLFLPVDFSPDGGQTFITFDMKHASGADAVGVPASVLSQFSMKRDVLHNARIISGVNGDRVKCNVYKDVLFRLNGLVTKTEVVQLAGSRWLLSQPIYLRYKNVIDRTAPQILTMEPLPGEEDHTP